MSRMNTRGLLFIGAGGALLVASASYAIIEISSLRAKVFAQQEREAELVLQLETETRAGAELQEKLVTQRVVLPASMSVTGKIMTRVNSTPIVSLPKLQEGDRPGRAYREQIRVQEEIMRRVHDPRKTGADGMR